MLPTCYATGAQWPTNGRLRRFAALGGHKEITELLIDSGAEVNAKSYNDGWAPLHGAAQRGRNEIVELLIAEGADVNAMGRMGTPLYYAAARGRNKIVELLIAKGADVNILNDFGKTPLDIALPQKQTRRTIPTRQVRRNDYPEIAALLRKHGGKTSEELQAELIEAIEEGDIEAVKKAIADGEDVNAKREGG